jgi:hypothetical protein
MMPMCGPEDARWHVLLIFQQNDGLSIGDGNTVRVIDGYYPWFPGLDQFSALCPVGFRLESAVIVRFHEMIE